MYSLEDKKKLLLEKSNSFLYTIFGEDSFPQFSPISLKAQQSLSNHLNTIIPFVIDSSVKNLQPTLITGIPGTGKSFIIRHCVSKFNIAAISIRGYTIRSLSKQKFKEFLDFIGTLQPILLILEELEALSRKENETQEFLLQWLNNYNFDETGIYPIIISQSPERFPGQYPHQQWNHLNNICNSFHITLDEDDFSSLWTHHLNRLSCSIDLVHELSILSKEENYSISDIICFTKELEYKLLIPNYNLSSLNQKIKTILLSIYEECMNN